MNIVVLTGRLGKAPYLRYTAVGTAYCRFSLATTERFKGESWTAWNNTIAWGKPAKVCTKHLTNGSKIGIKDEFSQNNYAKDGVKKTTTEVMIEELKFLDHESERGAEADMGPADMPF